MHRKSKSIRFHVNKSLKTKTAAQLREELFYRVLDGNKAIKKIENELRRRGLNKGRR